MPTVFGLPGWSRHAIPATGITPTSAASETYGSSSTGNNRSVLVEFVSANPTGPLHVGHGRLAALGDCLARLLEATGHEVWREYYVNDAGRQLAVLGLSVWLRMLKQAKGAEAFPEGAIEIKRFSNPRPEKGFSIACDDLRVKHRYLAYPGNRTYQLPGGVWVAGLVDLMTTLRTHTGLSFS